MVFWVPYHPAADIPSSTPEFSALDILTISPELGTS
jgi:hypothetical protein